MLNHPHVLLACLEGGEHVQVGTPCHHDDAHAHHEYMDSQISGFVRENGRLRLRPEQRKDHYFDGKLVRFYRVRQADHEFGTVRTFPLSAVRYTNRKAVSRMTSKTPSGIARPKSPVFSSWERARSEAKALNVSNGRGYRALKASTGSGYTVIFRPAVANNKQRKVRAL